MPPIATHRLDTAGVALLQASLDPGAPVKRWLERGVEPFRAAIALLAFVLVANTQRASPPPRPRTFTSGIRTSGF